VSQVEERWQQIKSTDYSSVIGFQQGRTKGVLMLSKGEWASPLLVGHEGEGFGKTFESEMRVGK